MAPTSMPVLLESPDAAVGGATGTADGTGVKLALADVTATFTLVPSILSAVRFCLALATSASLCAELKLVDGIGAMSALIR